MKTTPLGVLRQEEVERIPSTSMEVLATVGVKVGRLPDDDRRQERQATSSETRIVAG